MMQVFYKCKILIAWALFGVAIVSAPAAGQAPSGEILQVTAVREAPTRPVANLSAPNLNWNDWFGRERLTNSLTLFLILTVLSLVPAIVIMTTAFVRIVIVLSITRQALGIQNLPPNAVLTTLALFLTAHVMAPVFNAMFTDGVQPYSRGEIDANQMVQRSLAPLRSFMATQIENTHNQDDVWLFVDHSPDLDPDKVQTYDDVPLRALLPAYLLSEIRTAFLIGFQIFLPFVIIDLAVASILVSMGMQMAPPVFIALPLKLLLFVLADGWTLIARMLLVSFAPESVV